MNIDLKDTFTIVEDGHHYQLPDYEIVDGQGLVATDESTDVRFVRGSKLADEDVDKREGTLHEHLLAMMIHDLTLKAGLVPSTQTLEVIRHLRYAQLLLLERQIDRARRSVVATYQK